MPPLLQIPASWATQKAHAWGWSQGISIMARPWPVRLSSMVAAWAMATTLSQRRSVCRPAELWVSAGPLPLCMQHLTVRLFPPTTCQLNAIFQWRVDFQGKVPEVRGIAHLHRGDPRQVISSHGPEFPSLEGLGGLGEQGLPVQALCLRSAVRITNAMCLPSTP